MLQIQIRPYYRHKISTADLKIAADLALKKCQQTEVVAGILITGDAEMHTLNREYRGIDQTTDVLSFDENYIDPESGLEYLGDIIISVPRAKKQALEGGHKLEQEIQVLVVHGILHLSGYDHNTKSKQKKMWGLQAEILKELNNPLAGQFTAG
jgi:probable rRNA maturation factor